MIFCTKPKLTEALYICIHILSRVGDLCVTYKTGSGLEDLICCTLYIHTVRDYK
jgi:hypothetical protein